MRYFFGRHATIVAIGITTALTLGYRCSFCVRGVLLTSIGHARQNDDCFNSVLAVDVVRNNEKVVVEGSLLVLTAAQPDPRGVGKRKRGRE